MIFGCPSCVVNNCFKVLSYTTGWILTKLARNDPYVALFNNCSNGSGPVYIQITHNKIDFRESTCSNCAPGAKNGPTPGVPCFTKANRRKTLEKTVLAETTSPRALISCM